MNEISDNKYLLIMPNGDTKTFEDLDLTKAYVNRYYEKVIDHEIKEDDYNDITEIGAEEPRKNICTQLGVDEGKCKVYSIEKFIKAVESNVVFASEKEEIISNILKNNTEFNVYDYNLDIILSDIEEIDIMENFGEVD